MCGLDHRSLLPLVQVVGTREELRLPRPRIIDQPQGTTISTKGNGVSLRVTLEQERGPARAQISVTPGQFKECGSLLVLSNGHGEDEIAVRIIDQIRAASKRVLNIGVWPLVGEGHAYRRRGLPIVGDLNVLPGEGFGGLDVRLMLFDLRAGWIGNHWRQFRSAKRLAGAYRLAMVVGDVVPMLAAAVTKTPFIFVGCAKSSYSGLPHCYSRLERRLLRNCSMIYPRDALTAAEIEGAGMPVRFVGNPMMDGLAGSGERFGIERDASVVTMLAGSRADAETNTVDLLEIALHLAERPGLGPKLRFLVPAHQELDFARVRRQLGSRNSPWQSLEPIADEMQGECSVHFHAPGSDAQALLVKGRFADCLRLASVAIGMAGTANEQAIGLGVPLIAVPTSGVQGEKYVQMKMKYFGRAAIAAAREPAAIGEAIDRVLRNPELRRDMISAGRARMGEAGASASIARDILRLIE
jgi:uncharacterized protein (TIGR03492 family)